ncbi:hypothetical protein BESB_067180 [Besnoitia besnoiti]|uniref:Uncharacterized protein n=1 Tax=Besnoitia besnoiti TaxID=94643 RepID=A0A2A9M9K9_BESBE|nr:hypothetical protein BESB_067180 [Besnoitia besnoiti]PFH34685.1 hypothetical protein BESB_067180 [Besnoitia besnoiti]
MQPEAANKETPLYTENALSQRQVEKRKHEKKLQTQRVAWRNKSESISNRPRDIPPVWNTALETEIRQRCQPGFFVPCHYMRPIQQYMELYQRNAAEWQRNVDVGHGGNHTTEEDMTKAATEAPDLASAAGLGVWEYGDLSQCAPYDDVEFPEVSQALCDRTEVPFRSHCAYSRPEYWPVDSVYGRGHFEILDVEAGLKKKMLRRATARILEGNDGRRESPGRRGAPVRSSTTAGGDSPALHAGYASPPVKGLSSPFFFAGGDSAFPSPRLKHRKGLSSADPSTAINISKAMRSPSSSPAPRTRAGDVNGELIDPSSPLEKNIESQYLQMELYEKGYGRKVMEEVLRSPPRAAENKAKGEQAAKPCPPSKKSPPRPTAGEPASVVPRRADSGPTNTCGTVPQGSRAGPAPVRSSEGGERADGARGDAPPAVAKKLVRSPSSIPLVLRGPGSEKATLKILSQLSTT